MNCYDFVMNEIQLKLLIVGVICFGKVFCEQNVTLSETAASSLLNAESSTTAKPETFRCACGHPPYPPEVPSFCTGGICRATTTCYSFTDGTTVTKGCHNDSDTSRLQCTQHSRIAMECCHGDMCNRLLQATLPPVEEAPDTSKSEDRKLAVVLVSVFIGFAFVAGVIIYARRKVHKRRMKEFEGGRQAGRIEGGLRTTQVGESTLADWMLSATSGSGSGLPVLTQATMARQINLMGCIGKGKYGEVWKGSFQGEMVAVKIFASRDQDSWSRETDIYNTVLLRHPNILGFIAADMTCVNSEPQLWLVCYYHPYGSLYEFLQSRVVDHKLMLQLCLTAANGLAHLHRIIVGVCGKPAIAHRDIKSKNILVKEDMTCCIADLGLAVTQSPEGGLVVPRNNNRVGTKRYMAPEVLDESLNTNSFECFKQADVYAFGLVLWEVARRCVSGGLVEEYRPPFYDAVNSDPSFEEMKKVVCSDEYRPIIPNRWTSDASLHTLSKVMKETWYKNPSSRLTILRIKKTLLKVIDQLTPALPEVKTNKGFNDLDPLLTPKNPDSSYANNLL